jgi:hypothetical protein
LEVSNRSKSDHGNPVGVCGWGKIKANHIGEILKSDWKKCLTKDLGL